jgi:hypothetical protein
VINNDAYLYNNLRNDEFWNWKHPFEKKMHSPPNPEYVDRIDPKMLDGFRKYIEDSPQRRMPSIANHILSKKKL